MSASMNDANASQAPDTRQDVDSQDRPTSSTGSSRQSGSGSTDGQSSPPRRQLRERSSISAHRPRPALTSSARGIAKLEMRRQKEREANEAYARANAAALEQQHGASGRSNASDAGNGSSQARPPSEEGIDESGRDAGQTGEGSQRDEQQSQLQQPAFSQSDFFASPRSPASQKAVEKLTKPRDNTTNQHPAPDSAQQAESEQGPSIGALHDGTSVHDERAPTEDLTSPQSQEQDSQPPRKKPRTFVEPEDEFDDDDDHGFFEALAECDLNYETSRSLGKPLGLNSTPKIPAKSAQPTGFLFQKANNKPISFNTSAMKAQIDRFKREFEDSESSEGTIHNEQPSEPGEEMSHKEHVEPFVQAETRQTEADDHHNLSNEDEAILPTSSAVQADRAREPFARETQASRSTPFSDRTNQAQKRGIITRGNAQIDMSPEKSVMPSTPVKEVSLPHMTETPLSTSHAPLSTPKSLSLRQGLSKRLGAGRLSSPSLARASAGSPLKTSINLFSNARSGRVSLGTTMLRKSPSTPKFKTPFKSETAAQTQKTIGPYGIVAQEPPTSQKAVNVPVAKGEANKIFDLSYHGPRRKTLMEAITQVESTTSDFVRGWMGDACEDLITILSNPKSARRFAFPIGEDGTASVEDARDYLAHVVGCNPQHIPLAWVRNHWGLVVWKLAALVRHISSPDKIWTYESVCRQLRYRYEREIHLVQRSAIKRIQELDSSPARPLVLCVYSMDNLEEEQLLTLTDGWYLIEAVIDEPLRRAVAKGKIKLGSKLLINQAALTGDSDGEEPIKAFAFSFLKVAGNAVKLAKWDARLGFAKCNPIATARSLTSDGGLVPLMDVVVTKVFPIAYMEDRNIGKASAEQGYIEDAWSAEEEEERRRRWAERREEAENGLDDVVQDKTAKLDNLLSLIMDTCEDAGIPAEASTSDIDPSSCEGTLDAMLTSSNPAGYLRMRELLLPLRLLAEQRLQRLRDEARYEAVESLNAAMAERNVRSFCQIRVCDTALANERGCLDQGQLTAPSFTLSGKLKQCHRTAQIRFWNIGALKSGDRPKEGQRFLVTDLIPTKKGQWPKTPDEADEIHLATTQSSKWTRRQL